MTIEKLTDEAAKQGYILLRTVRPDLWTNRPRIKISKNFYADEILPPQIHNNPRLDPLWFIDPLNVRVIQSMRDRYGPCTINDWYAGAKDYYYSGYRHRVCTTGASESFHRQRIADDMKFKNVLAPAVIDDIIGFSERTGKNKPYFSHKITCVERSLNGKRLSWTHIDLRPVSPGTPLMILDL